MKALQIVAIVLVAGFALVTVNGCCATHCSRDTDGVSFTTSQTHYPDGSQVDGTVSNLSLKSIEIERWSDLVAYKKEHDGWVTQYPCNGSVILGKELTISSGDTWEIGTDAFDNVTCIITYQRFLPDEEMEGIYVLSIGYRVDSCSGAGMPPLVLYSNEFQVGNAGNVGDDFEVTIEHSEFLGFSLHNRADHPIWFIPPRCAAVDDYSGHRGLLSAPYVLQRQTDTNAWEVFYPDENECLETTERIQVEAGDVLRIEARLASPYVQDGWPAGRYRWKVLYQPDLDDWRLRHVFSPVFEYDGTSATAAP